MDQHHLNVLYSSIYHCVQAAFPDALRHSAAPVPDVQAVCSAASCLMHEMCGSQKGRKDALGSLFNHLNQNHGDMVYPAAVIGEPVFPQKSASAADAPALLEEVFQQCSRIPSSADELNHLLELLEKNASYLPDPAEKELSLFDTAKLNAAVASVLYACMEAQILDAAALNDHRALMQKEIFLLFSFDTSGIQSFIYTISRSGALKGLRARSFYLEMVMEVIVDELLRRAGLSRANLIYTGGGHAYVLLPNTPAAVQMLSAFTAEVKAWFRSVFRNALYLASGCAACSAASLANQPAGSYRAVFRKVSAQISEQKLKRYSAAEIMEMNRPLPQHERECRICRRSDSLGNDGLCTVCGSLNSISSDLLTKTYFVIRRSKPETGNSIALPFGYYLTAKSAADPAASAVRIFSKNQIADPAPMTVRMWMGDYVSAQTFEDLAKRETEGICRLGVLRADVDNLGQAFIAGFDADYMSLPRASAFSAKLSLFFKYRINQILMNGRYHLSGSTQIQPRKAAVVYAGGDDLFVVGAWDDVIGFAVDLHEELTGYTQDTLHISGGIGLYPPKYPIASMARETGLLEEYSKRAAGKNALTLFDRSGRYSWEDLLERVLDEKLTALEHFFANFGSDENSGGDVRRGNSMLYKLMTLVRETEQQDRMSIPRIAYFLARLRPVQPKDANPEKQAHYEEKMAVYRSFADQLYTWVQDAEERRRLLTAIQIYVYLHRDSGSKEDM